jgi:hypothetical protein
MEASVKDWHQFLRDERARKLASIEMLAGGVYHISRTEGGEVRDMSEEIIADYTRHIAEIESILATAGEPFGA